MMTERTAEHGPDSPEDPSRAEERVALLALGRLRKIGPQRSRMLVDHCGSARAALSAPDTDWEAVLGKSTLQRVNRSDNLHWAHEQLRRLEDRGGFLVAWGDRDYPSWLAEAADAPLSLYALGDRRLLQPPAVATVGSRRCTSYGKRVSTQLGSDLATAGVIIVSGLARGIDGAAHEGALHAGGATIAVLGGGVDAHLSTRSCQAVPTDPGRWPAIGGVAPRNTSRTQQFPTSKSNRQWIGAGCRRCRSA
ncbi:MAG TPA: DNA-processing protein DprA [Candidatus Latescibacteria bacterium]|jgi:DNA processing protein|nr:DNA-processing protein DprA [Candidatus Latescibacterota bacterium]